MFYRNGNNAAPALGAALAEQQQEDAAAPAPDAAWAEDDDGGATVFLGGGGAEEGDVRTAPHDANLAEYLDDSTLSTIAEELLRGIDADLESREEWDEILKTGMDLLGMRIEDRTYPFAGAAGVYHPVMTEAVVRFQATARGEMLPASGPVRTEVIGDEDPDSQAAADRVKDSMNYYLTVQNEDYYPDYDRMLMWLGVSGNCFKKVYRDPLKGRPEAPFVLPDQLIVNYGAASLDTAERITHVIPTTKTALIRQQLLGVFRDVDLQEPGQDGEPMTAAGQKRDELDGRTAKFAEGEGEYVLFESHCQLDIPVDGLAHVGPDGEETGLPLPYIVTVDRDTRKILGLYRNWDAEDPKYATGPDRRDMWVHYPLIPGLGFYAFGFAHLLGGIAKGSTMLVRQLIDSGTLANFPGGLRVKGMKMDDSTLTIGPCEFREVDTGGLPIQDSVMALPYKDPSEVLLNLLNALVTAAQRLGATADLSVGEGRQDAPVGTTVALLEQAVKVMSAIQKRLHVAHRRELRLLAKLMAQDPTAKYPFAVNGQRGVAIGLDFARAGVDILPVSDPNLPSQAQRLAMADAKLKLATQAPQIHDLRAAYTEMYQALGASKQEIDRLLPPPEQGMPADPVTELQMALKGKPLMVGPNQLDDAHIAAHMGQLQIPGVEQSPAHQALMAHIGEHIASKYRKLVGQHAQQMGIMLPPPGQPLPPMLENRIAMLTAQASDQVVAQFQRFTDPAAALQHEANALKEQELQIKREDAMRKAQESEAQNRTELVKLQGTVQNDAAERASRERQAMLRVEAERIKAQGNVAAAHVQAGVDSQGLQHETYRAELDHHATMRGHGIAADRLPVEKTQADAAVIDAEAAKIEAKKPTPRPAPKKK